MQRPLTFYVDYTKNNYLRGEICQGDSIIITCNFFENGTEKNIEGENLQFDYCKPDGETISLASSKYIKSSGNQAVITVPIDSAFSNINGNALAQVIFNKYGASTATFPIEIKINKSVMSSSYAVNGMNLVLDSFHQATAEMGQVIDNVNKLAYDLATKKDVEAVANNTATKETIEELRENKADKSQIWNLSNMGQDIKEALTGGSVAVVGKNCITKDNIVDNSVTERNVSFIDNVGINLYDKDYLTSGILVHDNTVVANANYYYTDFIAVNPGDKITISQTYGSPGCAYNANKEPLGKPYILATNTSNYTFTVSADVKYIRLNVDKTLISTFNIIKGTYIPPGEVASYKLNSKVKVYGDQVESLSVSKNDCMFFANSFNMFNKSAVADGILLTDGTISALNGYAVSNFIPVNYLDTITVSKSYSSPGCAYDADKKLVAGGITGSGSALNYSFTINNQKIKYIRVNLEKTLLPTYMMVKNNDMPATYIPYELTLDDDIKVPKKSTIINNKWYNKKIVCFGDSITWYDGKEYNANTLESGVSVKGYESYIREELGCTVDNQGVSGNTTAQICARVKAFDFSSYDLVTLFSGTNDFRDNNSGPTGTLMPIGSDFDESTFIGAYQSEIEYILNNNPRIRIMMFTPFKVWYSRQDTIMPSSYIDAIKSIASLYGIPCLDQYNNSGINQLTRDTLIVDDYSKVGYYFHPSTAGYQRISSIIIPFLLNN